MDGSSDRSDSSGSRSRSTSGRTRTRASWATSITLGVLTTLLSGSTAWGANHDVNSDAQLRSAITSAVAGDTITFTGDITIAATDLPAVQTNVTILGNNHALDGAGAFRGLFVGAWTPGTATQTAVTVGIQDLTIQNAKALGGAGGSSGSQGAGAGAGLGGALFVANQAHVTLTNVNLATNNAAGGTGGGSTGVGFGGGGGLGGNGGNGSIGTFGGGGGLGVGANGGTSGGAGSSGIATGAASGAAAPGGSAGGSDGGGGSSGFIGGGGGVSGASQSGGFGGGGAGTGGNGGFGGGGGPGFGGDGGDGGFGGGGGGRALGNSGVGGFGGGDGGLVVNGGGGGGLGAGGAIFVQQGGTLLVGGALTVNGNTVTAGAGAGGGANGSAYGSGLFLQGNGGTINFAPGSGQTQTFADGIYDQTGVTGIAGNSWSLNKSGAGTLVLSGTNGYSGGTTVDAGRLAVNGLLNGNVLVNSGGTLGGNGSIAGDLMNNGTFGPGNSIGALTLTGNYAAGNGSTTEIEINNGGTTAGVNNDRLNVTGNLTLDPGSTLAVKAAPGTYANHTTYRIITFTGTRTGMFGTATIDLANTNLNVLYLSGAIDIELLIASLTNYAALGQTGNQINTGAYLDSLGGSLPTGLDQIQSLSPAAAANALQQLGTEVNGSLAQLGAQNSIFQFNLLSQRAGSGLPIGTDGTSLAADEDWFDDSGSTAQVFQVSYNQPSGSPAGSSLFRAAPRRPIWGGWVSGYGLGGTAQSDGNASGGSYGLGGTIFALERRLDEYRVLGLLGSYSYMNLKLNQVRQSSNVNSGQFGTYLLTQDGASYNLLAGTLGFDGYSSRRQINFGGVNAVADGDYSGWQSNVYFERGWKLSTGRWLLQPYGGLQYNYLRQNS